MVGGMYRTALVLAFIAAAAAPGTAAVAADSAAGCPAERLCLYAGDDFSGRPVVVVPPERAAGQCSSAPADFRAAVNNSKFFVVTYSRPNCTIPPVPLTMCCSDGLAAGKDKKFGENYRSVKWMRG